MAINRQAFNEIADLLGERNISEDPAVIVGYAWNSGIGGLPKANRLHSVKPEAVVLPSTAEEVASLVKICNRHKIFFKAHSTGYGSQQLVARPNTITVDLRRMNRIHSIDAENSMAVIEPYVTAGQLQSEAIKLGMTTHIVGAGQTHSPLASATSMFGIGITGTTTGTNARNLLSFEWVTPTGELKRIGSSATSDEWFASDGPGPGFRGIMRGQIGAMGGLGIFTKIGYKLYPWPGEPLEITGTHPKFGSKLTDTRRFYQIYWDDWDDVSRATFQINESRIAYNLVRVPPDHIGYVLTASNTEFIEQDRAGTLPDVTKDEYGRGWTLITSSNSSAEAEYKEDVLLKILNDTGGKILDVRDKDGEMLALSALTSCYIPRVFRPSAGDSTSYGVMDSFSLLKPVVESGAKHMVEDRKPGGPLVGGSKEEFWIWPNEGRQLWAENICPYDPASEASRAASIRYQLSAAYEVHNKGGLGQSAFTIGPMMDLYGKDLSNAPSWMRKAKTAMDPECLSDPLYYVGPNPLPMAKYWPFASKILFLPVFKPMLKIVTVLVSRGWFLKPKK